MRILLLTLTLLLIPAVPLLVRHNQVTQPPVAAPHNEGDLLRYVDVRAGKVRVFVRTEPMKESSIYQPNSKPHDHHRQE